MITKWLKSRPRTPNPYKYDVEDIIEYIAPDVSNTSDEIINSMADYLLVAHGNPEMIRHECEILLEDIEGLNLDIIKKYLEDHVFTIKGEGKKEGFKLSTRIGNFGEVLAAQYLMESERFWFPIHKLRFREKKDFAMKLTDLCLIKTDGLIKPLICYGEVKTKSSTYDKNLGKKGHKSLGKDDALQKPEILRFVCNLLYSMERLDEANFLSKLRLGKIEYDRKHTLFLVHEKNSWRDEILDNLNAEELDSKLIGFSVNVIQIHKLRSIIDESYARTWQGAVVLLS